MWLCAKNRLSVNGSYVMGGIHDKVFQVHRRY